MSYLNKVQNEEEIPIYRPRQRPTEFKSDSHLDEILRSIEREDLVDFVKEMEENEENPEKSIVDLLTGIAIIMRLKPRDWRQALIEVRKYTFTKKLAMIRPEDVIKNNTKEEIQKLSAIVKSKGFQSAEDSESPFDTYETQLLSEWLAGTCNRVFAKTFRKRARVADTECRVIITNDPTSPPKDVKEEPATKGTLRKVEPSNEYVYKPPKKWSRRRRHFKKRND